MPGIGPSFTRAASLGNLCNSDRPSSRNTGRCSAIARPPVVPSSGTSVPISIDESPESMSRARNLTTPRFSSRSSNARNRNERMVDSIFDPERHFRADIDRRISGVHVQSPQPHHPTLFIQEQQREKPERKNGGQYFRSRAALPCRYRSTNLRSPCPEPATSPPHAFHPGAATRETGTKEWWTVFSIQSGTSVPISIDESPESMSRARNLTTPRFSSRSSNARNRNERMVDSIFDPERHFRADIDRRISGVHVQSPQPHHPTLFIQEQQREKPERKNGGQYFRS